MILLHKYNIITVLIYIICMDFILPPITKTIITTVAAATTTKPKESEFIQQNATYAMDMNRTASSRVLSRKGRYLAFPEGSSFSVSVCSTVGVIGNPNPAYLSYGLNWGIAYDLPNETWIKQVANGFKYKPEPESVYERRVKRSFYNEIAYIFSSLGYNGKSCLLRALCEFALYFRIIGPQGEMIEEILRSLFSFPKTKIYSFEHNDIREYDKVIRKSRSEEDCLEYANECHFSLLDLIFGYYSEPPDEWYWN